MTHPFEDVVLCVNSGSSSLKLAIFLVGGGAEPRRAATAEMDKLTSRESALTKGLAELATSGAPPATLVGHRVVHGGPHHTAPARIDATLLEDLRALVPLAPLHMPAAIEGIEAVAALHPDLPQVACFDTAFHATMPDVARRLPLSDRLYDEGIRRYGFHGLSYEYVVSVLGPAPPERTIIAHLGSGSSLVAVKGGRSIDTTMGLTPAGGVLMGTRTGDLDPGVLLYLLRSEKLSADALETLVERESGLSAIGGSSDMKLLLGRAGEDARAHRAITMFAYSVRKAVGSLAAALGGLDLFVFTGGIGEHAPRIRSEVCGGLAHLGILLDEARNAQGHDRISKDVSACTVRVIPTDEDLVIARHTRTCVRGVSPS
jgi:acetate kinase